MPLFFLLKCNFFVGGLRWRKILRHASLFLNLINLIKSMNMNEASPCHKRGRSIIFIFLKEVGNSFLADY